MIIGLTGSFGAGKGAVVDYLIRQKHFTHYSARTFITRELQKRGEDTNRDTMIRVANELRAMHGPAYIIESLLYEAKESGGDVVIESLRAVAEVRKFKELGAIVLGIDAEPKIRYERIVRRGSETDKVSYEEWLLQEQKESNPDDPTKQDIFGALKESNFIIMNNGTLTELHVQVENILKQLPIA